MERLQIALEKARASRQRSQGERLASPAAAATPAAPVADQAADPAPAAAAAEIDRAAAPAEAAADPAAAVEAAWAALPPIRLDPGLLRRNRVVTLEANADSLPFDTLRTRILQQAATGEGLRRIAVVSAHSGAGKSTLVANLAFCFGRQPELRTLVLDFDLRRPSLAQILNQTPQASLAEVIQDRLGFADLGLRHGSNLAFGLNRHRVRNASELLQGRDADRLLADLDQVYAPDILLFDMPPLMATDDALGFLRRVDGALIVAEAGRTPLRHIETVETQVAELTRVLGVVLNRCAFPDKDATSYGYY